MKKTYEKPSTGINFIWAALLFYNVLISVVSKHERKICVYFEKHDDKSITFIFISKIIILISNMTVVRREDKNKRENM